MATCAAEHTLRGGWLLAPRRSWWPMKQADARSGWPRSPRSSHASPSLPPSPHNGLGHTDTASKPTAARTDSEFAKHTTRCSHNRHRSPHPDVRFRQDSRPTADRRASRCFERGPHGLACCEPELSGGDLSDVSGRGDGTRQLDSFVVAASLEADDGWRARHFGGCHRVGDCVVRLSMAESTGHSGRPDGR